MSFWTAFVVTIAIIAFAVMKIVRYNTEHGSRSLSAPPEDGTKAQLAREVEELRERIKVLERIATDDNSLDARETQRIAEEIESLREKQG